jgi:hypothetical protein
MTPKSQIIAAIQKAVQDHYAGMAGAPAPAVIAAEAQSQAYVFEIGTLVVNQNPYGTVADLDLPTVYPDTTGETRRIRRTGVLRDKHAGDPLSPTSPIPGGTDLPLFYEELKSLEDDHLTEVQGSTSNDELSEIDKYHHNIVKVLRLRYGIKNRLVKTGPAAGNATDGYVLIAYSGGDGH